LVRAVKRAREHTQDFSTVFFLFCVVSVTLLQSRESQLSVQGKKVAVEDSSGTADFPFPFLMVSEESSEPVSVAHKYIMYCTRNARLPYTGSETVLLPTGNLIPAPCITSSSHDAFGNPW
jgi:hypothetical protein